MSETRTTPTALIFAAPGVIGSTLATRLAGAKAGLVGLAQFAAATYARYNMRVNCVAAGLTRTPLTESLTRNALAKTDFLAPADTTPLSKTEAQIPPTPPCVRRTLLFEVSAGAAGVAHPIPSGPRGRWDSLRAIAREFFLSLMRGKPARKTNPTQFELLFA